jgi:chemotaxis protein CheX
MNVKYINPLLESTITVLSTMAMVSVTAGVPRVKKGDKPMGEVTAMIDLAGSEANGSLAISFSAPAILDITKKMLGDDLNSIDDTIVDVVGEITNMITGSAKRIYSDQGMEFDLTLPSMTVGQDSSIKHAVEGIPILLPFSTEAGEFFVELCFN